MPIHGLTRMIRPSGRIVLTAPDSAKGRSTVRLLTLRPDPNLPTTEYPGDDLFGQSLFQLVVFGQSKKDAVLLRVVDVSPIASPDFVSDIAMKCVGLEEASKPVLQNQRDLTHGARLTMIWPGGGRTIYHSTFREADRCFFQAIRRSLKRAAVHKR